MTSMSWRCAIQPTKASRVRRPCPSTSSSRPARSRVEIARPSTSSAASTSGRVITPSPLASSNRKTRLKSRCSAAALTADLLCLAENLVENQLVGLGRDADGAVEGLVVDHDHEQDDRQESGHQGDQERMELRVLDAIEIGHADTDYRPHPDPVPHDARESAQDRVHTQATMLDQLIVRRQRLGMNRGLAECGGFEAVERRLEVVDDPPVRPLDPAPPLLRPGDVDQKDRVVTQLRPQLLAERRRVPTDVLVENTDRGGFFGPPSQGWRTFLSNPADGIASIDLFVVPTLSFRLLYGLLVLQNYRRRILWLGVPAEPPAE